jgi:hypothetical protein
MQLASHLLSCGLPDGHNILQSPQPLIRRHDAGAVYARGGHDDAIGGVAVPGSVEGARQRRNLAE